MKTAKYFLLAVALLAALAATAGTKEKAQTIKTFTTADPAISKDLMVTDDKAWLADGLRLLAVRQPGFVIGYHQVFGDGRIGRGEGLDGLRFFFSANRGRQGGEQAQRVDRGQQQKNQCG